MYLFAGQMLTWLPPLVFTAINEAGVHIRISMLSLLLFCLVAVIFLQCMGSYESAVRVADEAARGSQPDSETEMASGNGDHVVPIVSAKRLETEDS